MSSHENLSEISFSLPVARFLEISKYAHESKVSEAAVILSIPGFRHTIENIRDGLVDQEEITSEQAGKWLDLNLQDASVDLDDIELEGARAEVPVKLSQAARADLDRRWQREGFESADHYLLGAYLIYRYMQPLPD